MEQMTNRSAERIVLNYIISKGVDGYIDVSGIISSSDFYLPINRAIFSCITIMFNLGQKEFTPDTILLSMKNNGFSNLIEDPEAKKYIKLMTAGSPSEEEARIFALQVRKLATIRQLHQQYSKSLKYIEGLRGSESLAEIIGVVEGSVSSVLTNDQSDQIMELGKSMPNYVAKIMQEDYRGIDYVSGFPLWEEAIGGVRPDAVHLVGARTKVGKSFFAQNLNRNYGMQNIPVCYLDNELTAQYQQIRLLAMHSGCPIEYIEKNKFKDSQEIVQALISAGNEIAKMPLFYKDISGLPIGQILNILRRWIIRHVGINEDGKANPCLVIYDQFKIDSDAVVSDKTPETLLLGLLLTDLSNFSRQYGVPMVGFCQLNRDGIDEDHEGVIAFSDRITMLCSSTTLIKNKNVNDIDSGCTMEYGNKKLMPINCRYGALLEQPNDYINLITSLGPGVSRQEGTGHMREGLLKSAVVSRRPQIKLPEVSNKITKDEIQSGTMEAQQVYKQQD